MKKVFVLTALLIGILIFSAAGGVTISEKTTIVILPSKTGSGWNMDEVEHLVALLEEKALSLGRFRVFPRGDLQKIMEERNLEQLGITETQGLEIGKIAGAKYALILTLTELSPNYTQGKYVAVVRASIKLYDVTNGELLSSETYTRESSKEDTSQKAINSAINSLASAIENTLRNFFKIEGYIGKISNGRIEISGIDSKIVKPGYIFKVEADEGEAYIKVVNIDRKTGTAVAKFMYGVQIQEYDPVVEYPLFPAAGGFGLALYGLLFGFDISAWTDPNAELPVSFFISASALLGSILNYTPVAGNFGVNFNLLELGRINAYVNGGLSIIGLVDLDTSDWIGMIYGVFAGGLVTYDFNPSFGVYARGGFNMYLDANGPTGISVALGVFVH